jgi:hypothetical protein
MNILTSKDPVEIPVILLIQNKNIQVKLDIFRNLGPHIYISNF